MLETPVSCATQARLEAARRAYRWYLARWANDYLRCLQHRRTHAGPLSGRGPADRPAPRPQAIRRPRGEPAD